MGSESIGRHYAVAVLVEYTRGSSPCLESSRSNASRFMIFPVSFLTVSANDCNNKNGYSS